MSDNFNGQFFSCHQILANYTQNACANSCLGECLLVVYPGAGSVDQSKIVIIEYQFR